MAKVQRERKPVTPSRRPAEPTPQQGRQGALWPSLVPPLPHALDIADAAIKQCPLCDGKTFVVPCHACAARIPDTGFQNGMRS